MASSPSALKAFAIASRPKTLIAGISPVLIGFALAGMRSFPLFLYTLLFSVLIQIGTNYANDYYDFLSGADAKRVGPARATASGWITPEQMKLAFIALFGAAFLSSIPLIIECGPIALPFILSSIAFGILYTGGPKPLGYMGLGDILVLLYFGPIAIAGTYYVQLHEYPNFFLTLPPALLSVAILTANNLRDAETDKAAHKNTLVVRYGKFFGAWEYTLCVFAAALIPVFFGYYLPLLILPLFRSPFKEKNIAGLLPHTALLLILFTGLFCYDCSL